MEFRVLGPVEVVDGEGRLAVAAGRQLALLGFLVIHANHVVSADRIIDELWGDEPPESGAKTVAFHMSRLRDALEPGRARGRADGVIATEPTGYVLRVPPDSIDGSRFERLVLEGRALLPDDPEAARTRLAEALALWRGEPYADLIDESFAQPEIRRLEELRLRALEERLEADLATGRHAEVIDELEALVTEHPLRERLRGQLMVALYRAGRQADALRTYAAGRQVLAEELGIDPGPELQQLEGWILRHDPRLEPPSRRRVARNPYKGLRPFGEADSPDFFGREVLVARLVERLGEVARAGRLLAVVGPSGSGKSSAVRAGLIPAIRAGALPGSEGWRIALMQPGARPFRELAAALVVIGSKAPRGLADRLDEDGDIAGALERIAPDDARVLLVIDQLEELYSLVDEPERSRFIAALVASLGARDCRLLVVATLRADYFAHPLVLPGLGELIRTGTEVVTPLTPDELERAIVRPAESVGVQLEPGLVTEVISDVARQPGELPLLQYALTELFERSDGHRLTRQDYETVGGVLGALGRQADEVYSALDPDAREIARQAFLRMVVLGEAGEPVARRVAHAELHALADDYQRVDAALEEFGRRRLVSYDRDAASGEPMVQVAHEALLARWPRLAGWIEQAREDLWTRRRLTDAANDWIDAGRDAGYLLSGSRLELLASWAASTDLHLDAPERELLEASVAERTRQDQAAAETVARERRLERRASTRLRALVAVLAVAVVATTSLSVVVFSQGQAAQERATVALGRELAAASIGTLGTDPQLSLLLALQSAYATTDRGYVVEEAMDALHWAVQALHVAYPAGDPPFQIAPSPAGERGIPLLAPRQLIALAAGAASRALSASECRTYLHRPSCPATPTNAGDGALGVFTSNGALPVERLANASLAGTRVDAVSELPVGATALTASFESETGIDVTWAGAKAPGLEARVASGDLPDVAIVDRPSAVADLARKRLLVDLASIVDAARLRSAAGEYLMRLGTIGPDGAWPSAQGGLYGATLAAEVESLVWYPKAPFAEAGYSIPTTLDALETLAARMRADGDPPWCLGTSSETEPGRSATDFVEELLLHGAGPQAYDGWTIGTLSTNSEQVHKAFVEFGALPFWDRSSAMETPESLAAWPMFVEPPGCWLHLAGGTDRLSWPAAGSSIVDAFPFPAADPAYAGSVRGRAYDVVVFHDRPEVRRLVDYLTGDAFSTASSTILGAAGIWTIGSLAGRVTGAVAPNDVAGHEGDLLATAVKAGAFRVAAVDLMPAAAATKFEQGTVRYLRDGVQSLGVVLNEIETARLKAR